MNCTQMAADQEFGRTQSLEWRPVLVPGRRRRRSRRAGERGRDVIWWGERTSGHSEGSCSLMHPSTDSEYSY